MDRVCEVWSASTDLLRPAHAALLDDRELARAEPFSRPSDRARSLLAAALVRLVAARALDLDPADPQTVRRLEVDRGCPTCAEAHGKPSVGNGVHLSVSHARELVVVAVSRVTPVGVDVEPTTRDAQAQAAARWACAPEERAQIADARDALRYWIRKEAIVKATGEGLAAPLADVRVSAPREPARFLHWSGRPTQECTLIDLNPPEGYVASLAVLSSGPLDVVERPADDLLAA
jgi:4'-phosphopantetheinyl transferase